MAVGLSAIYANFILSLSSNKVFAPPATFKV